jgi:hypothetical protein
MDKGSRNIKPFGGYFKEAIKFYDLDKPVVARIIFILELAVLFGGYMLARPYVLDLYTHYEQLFVRMGGELNLENLNSILFGSGVYEAMIQSFLRVMLLIAAVRLIAFLISLFFGSWYFFGLTNPQMPGSQRVSVFFTRLAKIIVFNILFHIAFYLGVFVLLMFFAVITIIIPLLSVFTALFPLLVLAVSTLFVFKDLLIIEFDIGVFRNFKKTIDLTRGNKKHIIINMMSLYALGFLLNMFSVDVNNAVLSLFISAFLESIILLVTQRMSVLMFLDAASLERKDGKQEKGKTTV